MLMNMDYKKCKNCLNCLLCPITDTIETEGALPIVQKQGNIWYCSSCFYCEDVCPVFSPRQNAINIRRLNQRENAPTYDSLQKIKANGTIFPLTVSIISLRNELNLPSLPKANLKEIEIFYDFIIKNENNTELEKEYKKAIIPFTIKFPKIQDEEKFALFLGCLIPYRVFEYELSSRNLLEKLGIKCSDLPFICCGSIFTESFSQDLWLAFAAYNLALAEEKNYDTIITLCGGCTGNLRRANKLLLDDKKLLDRINIYLNKIGKNYNGKVKVEHISEFLNREQIKTKLLNEIDKEKLKKLGNLEVAAQVPCQIIRPKLSSPNANSNPDLLIDLLKLTGLKVQRFPFETLCCGSSLLPFNKKIAYNIAKKRIDSLKKKNIDALIIACGNCSMNYIVYQGEYNTKILPVFFLTEILDFAMSSSNTFLMKLIQQKKPL